MTELPAEADVVVVGYGYAGAVAAIAAADAGARVAVLEKAEHPGGISICSAGGLRVAGDAQDAFGYLKATCGGKTPDTVLMTLARGMTGLPGRLRKLAEISGALVGERTSPGNYPLPGSDTFAFAYVEDIPGFDPAAAYPHVRGSPAGAMLFRVLEDNVRARSDRISVHLRSAAARLEAGGQGVDGVMTATGRKVGARGGVVLSCGGFEGAPAMQDQYWPGGTALNAAYRHNTGDGIRMAQAAGADLWHMWHYHGSYGFAPPVADYPFGVRVKRLPDWRPGDTAATPRMSWILLDGRGRRFMNEYEPYMQDTGARPLSVIDPATQSYPRNPAYLLTDAAGMAMYPLGKPTRNDPAAGYEWSADNSREIALGLFHRARDPDGIAEFMQCDRATVAASVSAWNDACQAGLDTEFGRPPTSMHALATPPFFVARVHPIVSNTQGGPRHDEMQRVLDPFGAPIPGLYAAGECGSAFGHLYMSGGNLAECFIGGDIAGRNAATRAR